jgi:hypothetical protein
MEILLFGIGMYSTATDKKLSFLIIFISLRGPARRWRKFLLFFCSVICDEFVCDTTIRIYRIFLRSFSLEVLFVLYYALLL